MSIDGHIQLEREKFNWQLIQLLRSVGHTCSLGLLLARRSSDLNQLVFSTLTGVSFSCFSSFRSFCFLDGFSVEPRFSSNGLAFGVDRRRRIEMSIVCDCKRIRSLEFGIWRLKFVFVSLTSLYLKGVKGLSSGIVTTATSTATGCQQCGAGGLCSSLATASCLSNESGCDCGTIKLRLVGAQQQQCQLTLQTNLFLPFANANTN